MTTTTAAPTKLNLRQNPVLLTNILLYVAELEKLTPDELRYRLMKQNKAKDDFATEKDYDVILALVALRFGIDRAEAFHDFIATMKGGQRVAPDR